MPLPPIGSSPSYSVTNGPATPYSGTSEETFDPGDTLDLTRTAGSLFATERPFAPRPTGSTGNFLYVGPNGQGSATIDFAGAVHYYGFLWGSPETNPSVPGERQGVELYSGSELVATHTADSLGLNGDTRYVNFHAAQDKPFTRAVLFTHEGFETDNHATYTAVAAQPPTVSAPSSLGVTEDVATPLQYTGTPFADPDDALLSVTLSVEDGTIAAGSGTGITLGGTATQRIFSGTVADLNAYFTTAGKLSYVTAPDASGSRTLTTTVSDGTLSSSAGTTLNIAAVNDAPILTAPGAQSLDENTTLEFSGAQGNLVSVSDVDAGSSLIEVQLAATNGTVRLSGTTGLNLVAGADGTSSMTWQGRVADLNAALGGMRYAPRRDFNGAATLTIAVSDLGHAGAGGVLTHTRSVLLTINPADSAPTVAVPGTFRVTEDRTSPLVFTGTPFGDADSSLLTVTLAVADGTLEGASGNGITQGGTATARTFTGTVGNLNAYFTRAGSIAYTTAPNNSAARTLTTTVSDGNLSTASTSRILIDPEPASRPLPSPAAARPFSWAAPPPRPTGLMTFDRSVGPMSTDPKRPTETFEPGVPRSLEVSGGAVAGPTADAVALAAPARDQANHRMVVGDIPGVPQARQMTVDVSKRATKSLGFDWSQSRADQSVELYSGNRLLGRYGASDVFADASANTSASGYVTFRSLDGAPITKAVFSSSSPFEVDNVSTDSNDPAAVPGDAQAAASRRLHVRLGQQGQQGQPATGAAAAAAAPARPIVVPALASGRLLGLYGVSGDSKEPVVLNEGEIQTRARLMSAQALLGPAALVDKAALERAYGMRV